MLPAGYYTKNVSIFQVYYLSKIIPKFFLNFFMKIIYFWNCSKISLIHPRNSYQNISEIYGNGFLPFLECFRNTFKKFPQFFRNFPESFSNLLKIYLTLVKIVRQNVMSAKVISRRSHQDCPVFKCWWKIYKKFTPDLSKISKFLQNFSKISQKIVKILLNLFCS